MKNTVVFLITILFGHITIFAEEAPIRIEFDLESEKFPRYLVCESGVRTPYKVFCLIESDEDYVKFTPYIWVADGRLIVQESRGKLTYELVNSLYHEARECPPITFRPGRSIQVLLASLFDTPTVESLTDNSGVTNTDHIAFIRGSDSLTFKQIPMLSFDSILFRQYRRVLFISGCKAGYDVEFMQKVAGTSNVGDEYLSLEHDEMLRKLSSDVEREIKSLAAFTPF